MLQHLKCRQINVGVFQVKQRTVRIRAKRLCFGRLMTLSGSIELSCASACYSISEISVLSKKKHLHCTVKFNVLGTILLRELFRIGGEL